MPHRHTIKSRRRQNSWNADNEANSPSTFLTSASEKHDKRSAPNANHEVRQMPYDDSSPGQHQQVTSNLRKQASREESWTNTRAASKRTSTSLTRISGCSPTSLASISSALMTRCSPAQQHSHSPASRQNPSTTPYSPASSSPHNDSGRAENEGSLSAKQMPTSNRGDDMGTPNRSCARRTIKLTFGFTAILPSHNPCDDQTSNERRFRRSATPRNR